MNRIEEIKTEISKLQTELVAIQAACPHPPLVVRYKYCSNTGNFDRSDDCFWTELRCGLCGLYWNLEGSINPGKGAKEVRDPEKV